MSTLGKRIAQHRKNLGLTQDQLAEKLGITAQAVSKWENDLSCPDITMLPKLADIFSTTTDALLGRKTVVPICETEVIQELPKKDAGFTFDSNSGQMDFHWDGIKPEGISLACWVLLTGLLYLLNRLFSTHVVSLWNILWPSFLLIFGLFGLYPRFSILRLGCGLTGLYFLLEKFHILSVKPDTDILVAILILLFGMALLADALREKDRKSHFVTYTDSQGMEHHGTMCNEYTAEDGVFHYEAAFGEHKQNVILDKMREGKISTHFGDYTIDLSGVVSLEQNCRIEAECSFGNLVIHVPEQFTVVAARSTSFASFTLEGKPNANPIGTIYLDADVSFGQITVCYI